MTAARTEIGYEARNLVDGALVNMGEVTVAIIETPGHTSEHISLVICNRSRGEEPMVLFSGGALLVGDVGRPDLRVINKSRVGAPTTGYEKRMNQMLQCIIDQQDFESACLNLDKLPTVPPYWRRMRGQNQAGPAPLGVLTEPPAIRPDEFARRINEGALALDCRSPESFGGGHIPGSLNVGRGNAFPTWAGTVLPPDVPMLLILDRASVLWEITWHLLRIGYDLPPGWLAGGVAAWRTEGRPVEMLPQWSVFQLQARLGSDQNLKVLDVRQPNEWQDGHMPRTMHISGGKLPQRIAELPLGHPVAVHCGSGYRSSVAASLLQRAGHENVFNVLGGFIAWKNAGLPVER